jgi:hypothetical protein
VIAFGHDVRARLRRFSGLADCDDEARLLDSEPVSVFKGTVTFVACVLPADSTRLRFTGFLGLEALLKTVALCAS